jgi:hypothetical protein
MKATGLSSAACGCGCPGLAIDWPVNALVARYRRHRKGKDPMAQVITKSSKDLVKAAMATVPAICVEEALSLVGSPDHVFDDLRDGTEKTRTGARENLMTRWINPEEVP